MVGLDVKQCILLSIENSSVCLLFKKSTVGVVPLSGTKSIWLTSKLNIQWIFCAQAINFVIIFSLM